MKKNHTKKVTISDANNQKVIKLAENLILSKLSKYIVIEYYYILKLIEQRDINLEYWCIKEIITNKLIKSLYLIVYKNFIKSFGLIIIAIRLANVIGKYIKI